MAERNNPDQMVQRLKTAEEKIKILETELDQSRITQRSILRNSENIIAILDKDGVIVDASDRIERITGIPLSEIVGKVKWSKFVADKDIEMATKYFKERSPGKVYPPSKYTITVHSFISEPKLVQVSVELIPGSDSRIVELIDLSEIVQAQSKTAESEERYRTVIENTKDGILICRETSVIFANISFCNMTGFTREYIYSLKPLELFHEKDMDRILTLIRNPAQDPESSPVVEARIRKKKGYFPGELSTAGIIYRGKQEALISIRDLTQRNKTEKLLRENHELFKAIVDNSPVGVSVHDRYGTLLLANASWRKIWNKSLEDLIEKMIPRKRFQMDHKDSYLGDYIGAVEEIYREGGELHIPRLRIPNPSPGVAEWISHHFYALTKETGEVDKVVILTVDLTDSFRTKEQLEQSREMYEELSKNIPVAVYRTSAILDGGIISANPEMYRTFGISGGEDELRKIRVKDLYVDSDRRDELIERILNGEIVEDFETELKRLDGSTFLASISGKGIEGPSGKIEYIEGILMDISNKRRMEEELQKVENLESLGTLAGGIAHDFNNLLMSIQGNLSLALSSSDEDKKRQRLLRAERSAEDAAALAKQLLTFSKGGVPVKQAVDIAEIIRDTTKFALRGSNVQVEYSIDDDLKPVNADVDQIAQVIQNMVMNSIQAMPNGGTILISCRNQTVSDKEVTNLEKGKHVRISIKDTGQGISQENISKIFNPYFTTKADGSGLGLATCYSIIARHSGAIRVFSEPGKGTKFVIFLPVADSKPQESKLKRHGKIKQISGSILVMDDDLNVREAIASMLEMVGCQALQCADGSEALALYRENLEKGEPFDAVIMDLTIPGGLGGAETIDLLREIDPDVKAIVTSGYSNNPVISDYSSYGFSGRLSKPFSIDILRQELESVLGG